MCSLGSIPLPPGDEGPGAAPTQSTDWLRVLREMSGGQRPLLHFLKVIRSMCALWGASVAGPRVQADFWPKMGAQGSELDDAPFFRLRFWLLEVPTRRGRDLERRPRQNRRRREGVNVYIGALGSDIRASIRLIGLFGQATDDRRTRHPRNTQIPLRYSPYPFELPLRAQTRFGPPPVGNRARAG